MAWGLLQKVEEAVKTEQKLEKAAIQRTILRSKHDIGASPGGTKRPLSSSSRFRV